MRTVTRVLTVLAALTIMAPTVSTLEGCKKTAKAKGVGNKGASAKSDGQKTGGNASGAKSKAASKGDTAEDVKCDADFEGVAWCGSDTSVVFCSGGEWYELDCSAAGLGVCAEDEDHLVDCVSADDAE